MEKRIIYKNADGGVSVVIPALAGGLTVNEIADKDVPTGLLYKIVDVSEIPTDRTDRELWTVDDVDLTDGVGT